MNRSILVPLGAAALLLSSLTASQAGSGGGNLAIPGNTDIRALEPPIDIRQQQLDAQGYPGYPGVYVAYPPPYAVGVPQEDALVPYHRHRRMSLHSIRRHRM